MLLDNNAPFQRISKYKLKFKSKPWITLGLQKSVSVKNKLLTNFIKGPCTERRISHQIQKILKFSLYPYEEK